MLLCLFLEIKTTPDITINAPIICTNCNRSPKNINAKIIVEIGPKLPMMEKLEAPKILMAQDTRNEGIKVETIAIKKPSQYTSASY